MSVSKLLQHVGSAAHKVKLSGGSRETTEVGFFSFLKNVCVDFERQNVREINQGRGTEGL